MIDYADDVASDFSVFHRVDDVGELDSARFLTLARRLGAYGGAVTVVLGAERARAEAAPAAPDTAPVPSPIPRGELLDARTADGRDTPEDVVRQLQNQALAKRYGVDPSTISWVSGDEIIRELRR